MARTDYGQTVLEILTEKKTKLDMVGSGDPL